MPEKPNAIGLTDMSHRAATARKHVHETDPNWKLFLAHCGTTQPKAKQTELGSLLPPKLKVKARYLNLQTLLGWSEAFSWASGKRGNRRSEKAFS